MNLKENNKEKLKIDSSYIETCSEIELFIQINSYHQFLEQLKLINYYHKMHHLYQLQGDLKLAKYFQDLESSTLDRTPSAEELKMLENTLNFCILQTARFHTGVDEQSNGKVQITSSFENWYYSWMHYIENMDDESYMLYRKCRYEGKGLEQFKLNQSISTENVTHIFNSPKIKQYHYSIIKENIRQKLA